MNNKKVLKILLIVLLLAALGIGGFGIMAYSLNKPDETSNTIEGIEKIAVADFFYYKNEETNEREDIVIYFNEKDGTAEIVETSNKTSELEFELNEEQCKRLQELILQYGYKVEDKSEDYWPHTDEYPDMCLLFSFEVRSEEMTYKETGALCYPDGWEEFWEEMRDIIQK